MRGERPVSRSQSGPYQYWEQEELGAAWERGGRRTCEVTNHTGTNHLQHIDSNILGELIKLGSLSRHLLLNGFCAASLHKRQDDASFAENGNVQTDPFWFPMFLCRLFFTNHRGIATGHGAKPQQTAPQVLPGNIVRGVCKM